jgi:hypothetical protein
LPSWRSLTKIAGSPQTEMDPNPDPCQYVTDPQHGLKVVKVVFKKYVPCSINFRKKLEYCSHPCDGHFCNSYLSGLQHFFRIVLWCADRSVNRFRTVMRILSGPQHCFRTVMRILSGPQHCFRTVLLVHSAKLLPYFIWILRIITDAAPIFKWNIPGVFPRFFCFSVGCFFRFFELTTFLGRARILPANTSVLKIITPCTHWHAEKYAQMLTPALLSSHAQMLSYAQMYKSNPRSNVNPPMLKY